MKLPSQRKITRDIAAGIVNTLRHELDNGSEYIYDAVGGIDSLSSLSVSEQNEYERRVLVAVQTITRRILRR